MALSLYTDYGLRTLLYLAGKRQRSTIREISDFYAISKDHVAKVVVQLARVGYIRSIRGIGGGLELARQPEDIKIGDVIQVMEGRLALLECVTSSETLCRIQGPCKLRHVMYEAERLQMEYLNSVTLAQITAPLDELIDIRFKKATTETAT